MAARPHGFRALASENVFAAMATPVLATAVGGKIGGAPFLPSLGGSALGFGLGVWVFVAVVENLVTSANHFLYIAVPAAIPAGITTLIASAFD